VRNLLGETRVLKREVIGMRILHLAFEDPHQPDSGGGSARVREINRRLAERHEITNLVAGSRVAVTEETGEFLMKEHACGRSYESVEALRAANIDYVVIYSYLPTKGYNKPPLKVYRWVKDHGRLVYALKYRRSGLLGVWRLQDRAEDAAPDSKVRVEAVARGKNSKLLKREAPRQVLSAANGWQCLVRRATDEKIKRLVPSPGTTR
jgi:hypothetical protein